MENMEADGKRIWKIGVEALTGGILLFIYFLVIGKIDENHKAIYVIAKIFFSIGLPLVIVKTMSFVYGIISHFLQDVMKKKEWIYWAMWIIFLMLSIAFEIYYFELFKKGYIVFENFLYIIFEIWFLADINTTRCSRKINELNRKIYLVLQEQDEYIDKYNSDMQIINNLKEDVLNELKQLYLQDENIHFVNPLKGWEKNVELIDVEKYRNDIPQYSEWYKGMSGLLFGNDVLDGYRYAIEKFKEKMEEERKTLEHEKMEYISKILTTKKHLETAERSKKAIVLAEKNVANDKAYRKIKKEHETDVKLVMKNSRKMNKFWKNKMKK